jgi:stage II sporulation protein GA (sporulation sigma-E factor processing peptidase)
MQVTLYLDIIFLVNFIVDFAVLKLTAMILRLRIPFWRIGLAAVIGGVLCLPLLFIRGSFGGKYGVISLVGISMGANVIAFGRKGVIRKWFCSTTILFLLGSIMNYVKEITNKTMLDLCGWLVLWLEGLALLFLFIHTTKSSVSLCSRMCSIVVHNGEKNVVFKAFPDTGNFLWDPFVGKPVVLISKEIVACLVTEEERSIIENYLTYGYIDYSQMKTDIQLGNCFHEILYQSVGEPCGKLICFIVDEMIVEHNGVREKKQPVAVAPDYLFRGKEYQGLIGGCYGEYSQ